MRYILHVTSRAHQGREAEYDRWYGEVHVGEVLGIPGFLACKRYIALSMDGQETGEFVAQYEVETDDPAALLQSLFAASATMRMTEAIDASSVRFAFLRPDAQ